jgi:hypothetical protein
MIFDPKYFKKMDFSQRQIENYFISAIKDMKIAEKYDDLRLGFNLSLILLLSLE